MGWTGRAAVVAAMVLAPLAPAACDSGSTLGGQYGNAGIDGAADAPAEAAADAQASDAGQAPDCMRPPPAAGAFAWTPPAPFYQGRCTPADILDYVNSCVGKDPKPLPCQTFEMNHGDCAKCILTKDTDPAWGPLVEDTKTSIVNLNIAGCVANADGAGGACGKAYAAKLTCDNTVCQICEACTATFCDPVAAARVCDLVADDGPCAAEAKAASCADALFDAGGIAAACTSVTSFDQGLLDLSLLFCATEGASYDGGAPDASATDAGASDAGDAGDAGDADQ